MHIYLSCAVILMGTLTVASFSTLAMNYFMSGIDIAFRYTMELVGKEATLGKNDTAEILGFDVAGSWELVPDIVRRKLQKPERHLGFRKFIHRKHWLKPPDIAAFAMRYEHADGSVVYVTRAFSPLTSESDPKIPFLTRIILYAFIAVITFCICILFLLYQINKPFDRLVAWTKTLNSNSLDKPVPDFSYREINDLADIIHSSLCSAQVTLEREKKFISHASHELRTPISVVRSNTELLLKLLNHSGPREKQVQVAERVLRASISMTELCDTLLWLNRGEFHSLEASEINLASVIEQLSCELNYILKDKQVSLSLSVQNSSRRLPPTLVRIVLGNLMRNAFQHTYAGTVDIKHKNNWVLIRNQNSEASQDDVNLGFGLGLELSRQIIKQYNWIYRVKKISGGRIVFIRFS